MPGIVLEIVPEVTARLEYVHNARVRIDLWHKRSEQGKTIRIRSCFAIEPLIDLYDTFERCIFYVSVWMAQNSSWGRVGGAIRYQSLIKKRK